MDIEKHRHCVNCGISIPSNESFCSQKCEMELGERRRKVVKGQRITLTVLALIFLAMLFLFFVR